MGRTFWRANPNTTWDWKIYANKWTPENQPFQFTRTILLGSPIYTNYTSRASIGHPNRMLQVYGIRQICQSGVCGPQLRPTHARSRAAGTPLQPASHALSPRNGVPRQVSKSMSFTVFGEYSNLGIQLGSPRHLTGDPPMSPCAALPSTECPPDPISPGASTRGGRAGAETPSRWQSLGSQPVGGCMEWSV